MGKKLTINDFIKIKEKKKYNQIEYYYSSFLEGDIAVKRISPLKVMDLIDEASKGVKERYDASLMLIYEHCPDLKNAELLEEYGVSEPHLVVEKIFDSRFVLIDEFAEFILSLYGDIQTKAGK